MNEFKSFAGTRVEKIAKIYLAFVVFVVIYGIVLLLYFRSWTEPQRNAYLIAYYIAVYLTAGISLWHWVHLGKELFEAEAGHRMTWPTFNLYMSNVKRNTLVVFEIVTCAFGILVALFGTMTVAAQQYVHSLGITSIIGFTKAVFACSLMNLRASIRGEFGWFDILEPKFFAHLAIAMIFPLMGFMLTRIIVNWKDLEEK